MKYLDEKGKWIFKANLPDGKRANYLDAIKTIHLSVQELAPDLAKLEYTDNSECKNRMKAQITHIKVQLELLEHNL